MHRLVPDQAKAEHCSLFTFYFSFIYFFFKENDPLLFARQLCRLLVRKLVKLELL